MSITVLEVRNMAVEMLNQSDPGSAYGTITAERYKSGELDPWIIGADGGMIHRICNVFGHPRRKAFLTGVGSNLAYGAQLSSRIGPLESIQFVITGGSLAGTRAGKLWDVALKQELERENLNPLALTRLYPHYVLEGDTIYHNAAGIVAAGATSVSVNSTFCQYIKGAECQSPDEFLKAVALSSLAALFLKDGNRETAGNVFHGMLGDELQTVGVSAAA